MSRERIKEIVAEMQKGGPSVDKLVEELLTLKKNLGDPVPTIKPQPKAKRKYKKRAPKTAKKADSK